MFCKGIISFIRLDIKSDTSLCEDLVTKANTGSLRPEPQHCKQRTKIDISLLLLFVPDDGKCLPESKRLPCILYRHIRVLVASVCGLFSISLTCCRIMAAGLRSISHEWWATILDHRVMILLVFWPIPAPSSSQLEKHTQIRSSDGAMAKARRAWDKEAVSIETWWVIEKETRNRTSKPVRVVGQWPVSSWPFTILSLPNAMVFGYFVGECTITTLQSGWASSRGKFKPTGHYLYHRNLAGLCHRWFCYLAGRILLF